MRPFTFLTFFTVLSASTLLATSKRRRRSHIVRASLAHRRTRPPAPGDHRLSVVVPAYREPGIGQTVERLRRELTAIDREGGVEIVVVDDGSGDDTAFRAEAAGADQVIRFPANRGKGAAVRAGMLAATGRVLCFTDADLSYSPDQVRRLLLTVEEGWDVAIGSRGHEAAHAVTETSWLRTIGHRGVALLTRTVLVGRHADTQCGVKAFRRDAAVRLFSRARIERFAFDIEILHLVERYGYSLVDVPVEVENHERSTVRVGRDACRLVRDLARIRRWGRQGHYDLVPLTSRSGRMPSPTESRAWLLDDQASFG